MNYPKHKPLAQSNHSHNNKPKSTEPAARALMALGSQVNGQPPRSAAPGPHPQGLIPEPGGDGSAQSYMGETEAMLHLISNSISDQSAPKRRKVTQYDSDFDGFGPGGSWEKFLNEDIDGVTGAVSENVSHDGNQEIYNPFFAPGGPAPPQVVPNGGRPLGPTPRGPQVRSPSQPAKKETRQVDPILSHMSPGPIGEADSDAKSKDETKHNKAAWSGDGSEPGGSFDDNESKKLDEYLERFMVQNNMTREDLCQRVWARERKKDNFWDAVSSVLPHRTRASVYKHVRRVYHVFITRGKWSPAEDEQLGALVKERGPQWKAIGRTMRRMPEDCRDRWRNYVKCGNQRNQNKWTADEEAQLLHAVNEVAKADTSGRINWTLVSEKLDGMRSRIQCRYKWTKLARQSKA